MSQPATGGAVIHLTKLLMTRPREGMRLLLGLGLRDVALYQFAGLMVVLAAIVAYVLSALAPAPEGAGNLIGPLGYFAVAIGNLVVTTVLLFWGGKMIGGKGDFQSVLLAMSAHQGTTTVFQIIFALAAILLPSLGGLVLFAGVLYLLYLMAAYIAEVHALKSIGPAIGLIVGMVFLLSFVLLFLFSLLGIPIAGGPSA